MYTICGSELVKVWSALTLLGSYNGCLCVFHVEQVKINLIFFVNNCA